MSECDTLYPKRVSPVREHRTSSVTCCLISRALWWNPSRPAGRGICRRGGSSSHS